MRFGSVGSQYTESEAAQHALEVREARVAACRANIAWQEIDPLERLRPRGIGGRVLVDSETDLVYKRFTGAVFGGATAGIEFVALDRPLAFAVDRHGEVLFLEQVGAETWSEVCLQREREQQRSKR